MPGIELMENAGRAVADAAGALLQGRRVVVVAGPGNNGGDGFVAARHLAERGLCGARQSWSAMSKRLKGDAALAADRWSGPVEQASPVSLADCDIVIDALFGAGLDREVEGLPRAMIEAMNAAAAPVIAVDLPSGVNGTTGAVMGRAVNATHTVTFFRRKVGHMLLPGRLHCGAIQVADIGIPASVLETIKPAAFANRPALWGSHISAPARRRPQIFARPCGRGVGRAFDHGRGAAGGARRAYGRGRGSSPSPARARRSSVNAAANLAVMVRPVDGAAELTAFLADKRRNAVLLGPGGGVGPAMREQVAAALASGAAVVLDADALTSLAEEPKALASLVAKAARDVVLTPHEGEFARLFKVIHEEFESSSKT